MSNYDLKGLDIRSDEMQELLGAVPSWIQRWGIVLIAVILSGSIALCSAIRLPDRCETVLNPVGSTVCCAFVAPEVAVKLSTGQEVSINDTISATVSSIALMSDSVGQYYVEFTTPEVSAFLMQGRATVTFSSETILSKIIDRLLHYKP